MAKLREANTKLKDKLATDENKVAKAASGKEELIHSLQIEVATLKAEVKAGKSAFNAFLGGMNMRNSMGVRNINTPDTATPPAPPSCSAFFVDGTD